MPGLRASATPLVLASLAVALYAALAADSYGLRLLTLAGMYVLLIAGYQLVFGHAGALSLAQGAFFGLGAYAAAILALRLGLPAAVTLGAAILLPVMAAAAVAAPVLRLETHYFALATLALAQGALLLGVNWESLTGGANGLSGVPPLGLGRGLSMTVFVWALAALGCAFVWHMTRGAAGLAFQALRERPHAAAAMGFDLARMRFAAFVWGAALAGLAGGLHAHFLGVVSPETLDISVMVGCLTMAVIGGRTHPAGAIIGGLLLAHLPEWLRGLDRLHLIAYGAAALAMVIVAPEGLAGTFERFWRKHWPRPSPRSAAALPAAEQPSHPGPVLRASSLCKRFGGVIALDGVDVDVAQGEILGLMGPNGSGKTTLANLITGAETADSGAILLTGREMTALPAHERARAGVARTFQTPQLLERASALDNLALSAWARAHPDGPVSPWTSRVLPGTAAGPEVTDALAGTLPAGARRRLEVARAALQQPLLLVLDEPSAGLAPHEKSELAEDIRAVARQGAGVLVIEHDMAFLFTLADRVICLAEGRIIAGGVPAAVRQDPAVLGAYLGEP